MFSILFRIIFFSFLIKYIDSTVCEEENYSWKIRLSVLLTIDKREQGVVELTIPSETNFKKDQFSEDLEQKNSETFIELVVVNKDGEEVILYVTEKIYNFIYKKTDFRKNPNIFSRKLDSSNEQQNLHISSIPVRNELKFIRKYHNSKALKNHAPPLIESSGYKGIQIYRVSEEQESKRYRVRPAAANLDQISFEQYELTNFTIPLTNNATGIRNSIHMLDNSTESQREQ